MFAIAEDSQEILLDSCRRQLIEEGKMVLTDYGYQLTERGLKAARKELERYELRPALGVLVETHILNLNECPVW